MDQDDAATASSTGSSSTPPSHISPLDPIIRTGPHHSVFDSRDWPGDASPLLDPAADPWQYNNWSVPGWFVTDYDDENPLLQFSEDLNVLFGLGQGSDMDVDLGEGEGAMG
jgi:hypothetical protein